MGDDGFEPFSFNPMITCPKSRSYTLDQWQFKDKDEQNDSSSLSGGRFSKGVQAGFEDRLRYRAEIDHCSLDVTPSKQFSVEKIEKIKAIDRKISSTNPGTSNTPSQSTIKSQEGSLAVVYNYGEKPLENSRSSNLNHFYGSQGTRRLSNETVLLIEDYQSYDYQNTTHRQDADRTGAHSRHYGINCCHRRTKRKQLEPTITGSPKTGFEEISERDEMLVCRICHEGEDIEPLLRPCLCKGSVGFVHGRCLKVWLEQSRTSRCELCNYPYAIRQTKKYSKLVSVKVFFKTVVSKRSLAYDVISFVIITPLTLVGVVMCIRASIPSPSEVNLEPDIDASFQMENITKVGMIMLSATIVIAYGVWLYTLSAFHYKAWKAWYETSYDVEVLPVRMTSEEQLEAMRRLSQELSRRQTSRDQNSTTITILNSTSGSNFGYYQGRVSMATVPSATPSVQTQR